MSGPLPISEIKSVSEFLGLTKQLYVSSTYQDTWLYRGQSRTRANWPIKAKAGRSGFYDPKGSRSGRDDPTKWEKLAHYGYTSPMDMAAFSKWRRHAIAFRSLPEDDWECLALAQHYGLATRLLDWSYSPLVALFFAVCANIEENGAVYAYPSQPLITNEKFEEIEFFRGMMLYEPRAFDSRIIAQKAVFTFHPDPTREVSPNRQEFVDLTAFRNPFGTDLVEFLVPNGFYKVEILRDLKSLGISFSSLFPDLEGLSKEMNEAFNRFPPNSHNVSVTINRSEVPPTGLDPGR